MGSIFSSNCGLSPEELARLKSETDFSNSSIRRLHSRFQHLDKDKKGYLIRKDMMSIPEIHFNPIGERIVGSFFPPRFDEEGRIDPILSERVYFYDFAKNFSVFRPVSNSGKPDNANSKDDKLRFLFDLIDKNRRGKFSGEELYDVLEMMIGVNIDHDQLVHIVDRVVAEADVNEDGAISFEEFRDAVSKLDVEQKMAFVGFK